MNATAQLEFQTTIFEEEGEYEKAEILLHEKIVLSKKEFGEEYPNSDEDLYELALLCFAQGKLAEAEKAVIEYLAVKTKQFGADNPDVVEMNNLLLDITKEIEENRLNASEVD